MKNIAYKRTIKREQEIEKQREKARLTETKRYKTRLRGRESS